MDFIATHKTTILISLVVVLVLALAELALQVRANRAEKRARRARVMMKARRFVECERDCSDEPTQPDMYVSARALACVSK